MSRKRQDNTGGRYARGREHNQWPWPSVWGRRKALIKIEGDLGCGWGEHASTEVALDRWFARRDCDGTCNGQCERYRRLTRLRTMYARRRR